MEGRAVPGVANEGAAPPPRWWAAAFALLFAAYQLPQLLAHLGVGELMASAAMLGVYPVAAVLARSSGMRLGVAYGLHASGRRWLWLPALFAAAVAAKAGALALGVAAGIYTSHGPAARLPTAGAWSWLAFATLVPSLAEDILTRGVWRHSPLARRATLFVLGTAAVYTLNHVWRLASGPSEWLMLSCFGAAYAAAFWCTGTLWAAVGLHWGWNFAGQALDAVWDVMVASPTGARLLSAAAHLALGAAVIAAVQRPVPVREPREA